MLFYRISKLLGLCSIRGRHVIVAALWQDSDRGIPKYLEKTFPKYQTSHHKSQKRMKILMSAGFDFEYLTRPSWSKIKQMRNVYKILSGSDLRDLGVILK